MEARAPADPVKLEPRLQCRLAVGRTGCSSASPSPRTSDSPTVGSSSRRWSGRAARLPIGESRGPRRRRARAARRGDGPTALLRSADRRVSSILSRYTTIRAQLNVLVLPYYHPVRLAKSVATLDTLSGGRLSVGLGVGWSGASSRRWGSRSSSGARSRRSTSVGVQSLWRDRPATFEGRYVSFKNVVSEPRPFRGPQPDLWIGAGPSTKGIERAARVGADGITFMTRPRQTMEQHLDLARMLLSEAGREVGASPLRTRWTTERRARPCSRTTCATTACPTRC